MPSFGHEDDAYRLGRMVNTLTEELDIAVKAGRTFPRMHDRQILPPNTIAQRTGG